MESGDLTPIKRIRRDSYSKEPQRVLLYVRESHENVFTALLLQRPSLEGLADAVSSAFMCTCIRT